MKSGEFEEQRAKLWSVSYSQGELTNKIPSTLDLNVQSTPSCIEFQKNCAKPSISNLDLNSEDVSSSFNYSLSECGSTCGSVGEESSMRLWKQMKQNGFLSSSHGGVSVPQMPTPRVRNKETDSVIKKKIEIAKREQVDRFAKVAAPSGLLNGLNPGIINHVRNRKQVHSIIENLVRRNKKRSGELNQDDVDLTSSDDDVLAQKLSSCSTVASENMSSLSNEESVDISTVDQLSVKAANVASQWLELVRQDIKGRLAALRRSRKRVRTVTQMELPFLISKQSSSNQVISSENMHKFRWAALFDQMDKSLSLEEKHMENSLNQVREMLMHCEHGLLQIPPSTTLRNDNIFAKAEPILDKGLAIRAAAAAIYSTSSFLQPAENLPCF